MCKKHILARQANFTAMEFSSGFLLTNYKFETVYVYWETYIYWEVYIVQVYKCSQCTFPVH